MGQGRALTQIKPDFAGGSGIGAQAVKANSPFNLCGRGRHEQSRMTPKLSLQLSHTESRRHHHQPRTQARTHGQEPTCHVEPSRLKDLINLLHSTVQLQK